MTQRSDMTVLPAPPTTGTGADTDEIEALRDSVRGVCARSWPSATTADGGTFDHLWRVAASQGWTGLTGAALFPAAVAVQEVLGRVACPLPVVDAALVASILEARGDDSSLSAIESGVIRPVVGQLSRRPGRPAVRHVEAADSVTHVLAVDTVNSTIAWYPVGSGAVTPLPGLAQPGWSEVDLSNPPEWTAALDDHRDLALLRDVGLAARAAAAVERTHELAVEHSRQRRQFGSFIGSFQAVSHRLVDVEIALTAGRQLLRQSLDLYSSGDVGWRLAAAVYLEFVTQRLAKLQFDGHHTLAAIGYFDEHEAPWLFRRAHADLAVLAASWRSISVGQEIVERGAKLPEFDLGPRAEQVRREVLDAFAPWREGPPAGLHSWDDAARAVLREHGWIGVGWPRELGGGGYGIQEMLAFSEAIAYSSPPVGNVWMAVNSIVPMLVSTGPSELRDLVMEESRRGDLSIALGYSEPEAGSDLASLRTRAERVEGGWRINGQKMWGTCVPDSRLIALAARTDPEATPPHAGISIFLVDVDSPGITVQQHRSLGGDVAATTFWDDVFVPEERLVGEENKGWAALAAALAGERVLIGASVMKAHRAFEILVDIVRADPDSIVPMRRPEAVRTLGALATRLQAARTLVNSAVGAMTAGKGGRVEAPMAKILATELAEDLHATAISLLGPDALYGFETPDAVGGGWFEEGVRSSIMGVIAGGTGDIQRNLVARGMGLPR